MHAADAGPGCGSPRAADALTIGSDTNANTVAHTHTPLPFAGFIDRLPSGCECLRDYQRKGIAEIAQALHAGWRRVLRQLATGGGKTHEIACIALAAQLAGLRVLILCTRTRLIRQIHERLGDFGVPHGVVAAALPRLIDWSQAVQVASADTLYRRCFATGRMSLPTADVVIFDEAHLAAAESRMAITQSYPNAALLGFTATPARQSGRPLSDQFEHLILGPSMSALIKMGSLVRARIFNIPVVSQDELKSLRKDAVGDYQAGELASLMSRARLLGDVVENWLKIASGKRTIVFAVSKAHGAHLVQAFTRQGIAAEILTDQDGEEIREQVIGRLETGKTTVLVNCFLMAYGVDVPSVECIVLARPTRSLAMYLQMVGRGMRPAPGKDHFFLIDHGRVVENLGLPTEKFAWSLDSKSNVNAAAEAHSRTSGAEQPRTCRECGHMWLVSEEGYACAMCGWAPSPKPKPIIVEDAELIELVTDTKRASPWDDDVQQFFQECLGVEARRRPDVWQTTPNRQRAAAWHATREKFEIETDSVPARYWSMEPARPSPQASGWMQYRRIRYARSTRAS